MDLVNCLSESMEAKDLTDSGLKAKITRMYKASTNSEAELTNINNELKKRMELIEKDVDKLPWSNYEKMVEKNDIRISD